MEGAVPPVPFPSPVIYEGERDTYIMLEDGRFVVAYLRRVSPISHEGQLAYKRISKKTVLDGRGTILYGSIYYRLEGGRYRETGLRVVIKKLSRRHTESIAPRHNHPFTEISVAQNFSGDEGRHVLGMHEVLRDETYFYLIMPYVGIDLKQMLCHAPPPNDVELIRTLATNLDYLERHKVIHRDFSPDNVIVHRDLLEQCCPMIDFAMGLRCASDPQTGVPLPIERQDVVCGKWKYMSPEVFRQDELSFGVDVWALGCTLFLIWTRQALYDAPWDRSWNLLIRDGGLADIENVRDQIEPFLEPMDVIAESWLLAITRMQLVQQLSIEQRQLLAGIFRIDPNERMTARDILNHPHVTNLTA